MKEKWQMHKWGILNTLTISAITVVWLIQKGVRTFPFDSHYYWTTADPVYENGLSGFDILSYPETFRGCVFPLIAGFFKCIIPEYYGWWVLLGGLLIVFFALILPDLLDIHVDSGIRYGRNILLYLVFLFFWGGTVKYALSDFPAAAFLFAGIVLLKKLADGREHSNIVFAFLAFLAGIFLYAAYNTRAAFLYGALAAVLVFFVRGKKGQLCIAVPALAIGILLASVPQLMVNYQYKNEISPEVYTGQDGEEPDELQKKQVFWGIMVSRYETYMGSPDEYPYRQVYFSDAAGNEIVRREGLTDASFRFSRLAQLFKRYPLDMAGIYVRHAISLMSPLYPDIFIKDLGMAKGGFLSLGILIWFIAGYYVLVCRGFSFRRAVWLFPCVIPAFLQLAGAPELRFFLPVYLVMYGCVFLKIDYRRMWENIRKYPVLTVAGFVMVYIVWITILGDILAENQAMTILIQRQSFL